MIGKPLGPNNPPNFSFLSYNPTIEDMNLMSISVSDGIRKFAEEAISLGIDKVEDVATILENFRWMSWYHIALHGLRQPLTTKVLTRLIDITKPFPLNDDRIVKLLNQILVRAV